MLWSAGGQERRRKRSGLGTLVTAGKVIAKAGLLLWAGSHFLSWLVDRGEDLVVLGKPAMEQRLRRMRRFRQYLQKQRGQEELRRWEDSGVAGLNLRELQGTGVYSRAFEEQLMLVQPGARMVHQHEMVWIQAANGDWELVEALLDSGNNCGLVLSSGLAARLGYSNQAGVPHAWFNQGTSQVDTGSGLTIYSTITPVTFSIGGCELSMTTRIAPLGRPFEAIRVPVQAIRELQRRGIAYCMQ